jgi:hypothetical protein
MENVGAGFLSLRQNFRLNALHRARNARVWAYSVAVHRSRMTSDRSLFGKDSPKLRTSTPWCGAWKTRTSANFPRVTIGVSIAWARRRKVTSRCPLLTQSRRRRWPRLPAVETFRRTDGRPRGVRIRFRGVPAPLGKEPWHGGTEAESDNRTVGRADPAVLHV